VAPDRSPHELPILSRREFLVGSTALAGASLLVVAGCGGGTGQAGPTGTPSRWIRVSTAGLTQGEPRWTESETASSPSSTPASDRTPAASAAAGRAGTWLVLEADGSVAAFVPACTHERCFYDWDDASTRFACRCHKGFFTVEGQVISGPPPRPLDRFATRPAGRDAIEIGWLDGT
jgi:nitrite reductase/ring-hydroxylating ferredoxin subunit